MLLYLLKLKKLNNSLKKVLITSFIVVLVDQITKILVMMYIPYGYEGKMSFLGGYFELLHVTNNGMAFGLGDDWGSYAKLSLTLFRILIVILGVFYVNKMIRARKYTIGVLICFGLIIGGALGNIVDSVFYGQNIFYGEVVDMLRFPIVEDVVLPNWLSFLSFSGDGLFTFFDPVFNIADSSIFIGIFSLILFYRKQLS